MKKIVVITGACGFIGRYVAKEYSRSGYYVVGIGHGAWDEPYSGWGIDEWNYGDITGDLLQSIGAKPDVIVHCAGGSSVGKSVLDPRNDFKKTVDTVSSVLEYIRNFALSAKLVYLSSAAVYGMANSFPIKTNSNLNPISPYGVHKRMAEDLCSMYGKQYGVKSVIMRLFSVYGNGLRKQLLWDACKKISTGKNCFWGTGDETRDWIHVSDVARYLVEAQNYANLNSPIYNLAQGEATRILDVLNIAFRAMGKAELPVFTGEVDTGSPMHYWADVDGVSKWQTKPCVNLADGIKSYVEWFEENERNN